MQESNQNIENRLNALETEVARLKELISPNTYNNQIKPAKKLSIREFLMTKAIDNDVKRTIAMAYYLEKFEEMKSFNTDDLKRCYQLAKHPLPSNLNDKVNMGIKGSFLMDADEKKDAKKAWILTSSGEKVVDDNFIVNR